MAHVDFGGAVLSKEGRKEGGREGGERVDALLLYIKHATHMPIFSNSIYCVPLENTLGLSKTSLRMPLQLLDKGSLR